MKKLILILIVILFSISGYSQTFSITQSIGSKPTKVQTAGTFSSLTGFVYNSFDDTAAANVPSYIRFTPGMVILTAANQLWVRNATASAWVLLSGGGGGTVTGAQQGVNLNGANVELGGVFTTARRIYTTSTAKLGISGTNGTDSGYIYMDKQLFTNNAALGVFGSTTGLKSEVLASSSTANDGTNIRVQTSKSNKINWLLSDSAKIQLYASNTTGATNEMFIDVYPDSAAIWRGNRSSQLNLYEGHADQWARDSLIWRMSDRSAAFLLNPGVAEIYGNSSEISVADAGIAIQPYLGLLSVDTLLRSASPTDSIVVRETGTGLLKTRAQSDIGTASNGIYKSGNDFRFGGPTVDEAKSVSFTEARYTWLRNNSFSFRDSSNILNPTYIVDDRLTVDFTKTGAGNGDGIVTLQAENFGSIGFKYVGADPGYVRNQVENTVTPTQSAAVGINYAATASGFSSRNTFGGQIGQFFLGAKNNTFADSCLSIIVQGGAGIRLAASNSGYIKFTGNVNDGFTEYGRFAATTGYLGIGTQTPDSMLTVTQGIYGQRGVRFSGLQRAPGLYAVRLDAAGNLTYADTTTGGSSTWNGITNPTGDQALTFDAGESSTWTNSNTTEDLFTVNTSTLTTANQLSLVSTSTALAAGNEMLNISVSGANGTNAITATGARIAVTNTNATSGTNVGLSLSATGATTDNFALDITGGGLRVRSNVTSINSVFTSVFGASNADTRAAFLTSNSAGSAVLLSNASNLGTGYYIGALTNDMVFNNISAVQKMRLTNAGSVIVGSGTTATGWLSLPAGTATANTAPIKLVTGVNLTAAEAGAIEYTTPQLFFTNGGGQRQEIPQIQQSRVSTQFDKTSSTALANITGLTATVVAGKTYRFEATLYTTSNVGGGVQFAIAGTATATNIIYEGLTTDAGLTTQGRGAALATSVGAVTAVTAAICKISGTISVNAAGTLTCQFAQNVSNGAASSVLVGSTFVLTEML
jgi:hypothetical protein